jgi:hypothetical protein
MRDADKLLALVTVCARSTLLIATRLNALERAMQEDFTSRGLWEHYVKQLGRATNRATQLLQRLEPQANQELDDAIAELQSLLSERKS